MFMMMHNYLFEKKCRERKDENLQLYEIFRTCILISYYSCFSIRQSENVALSMLRAKRIILRKKSTCRDHDSRETKTFSSSKVFIHSVRLARWDRTFESELFLVISFFTLFCDVNFFFFEEVLLFFIQFHPTVLQF
jgi:hypothetical protein